MQLSRHCEPTGRANARPMTGSAKQSSFVASIMDCFVAFAPRNDGKKWTDLPDGQISRRFPVQPHLKKYFA
jgi:hypothetical protein